MTIEATRQGKAITKALRELLDVARENGCANPKLFFEAESGAVFVMDGDHPHERDAAAAGVLERQQAIVVEARIRVPFDTGAW